LRIAMLLPGLGRVQRGAEMAFLELARQWIDTDQAEVTVFASGKELPARVHVERVGCVSREWFERFPPVPCLRTEFEYEELTYCARLWASRRYRPERFDVALHCSYPYVNWFLQRHRCRGYRPLLAYVTQNGDWPCRRMNREYRAFDCDALICTNPEYYDRHQSTYPSMLIPNGVDAVRFTPRDPKIVNERPIVLIASALVPYKYVLEGIRAVAEVPEAFLNIAGDGPLRNEVASLAQQLLPGRHQVLGAVPRDRMPELYRQSDVFLHMSREEPSALVYCEAASAGLSMVVHDGTIPRWTLGDAALYADTSNISHVAAVLKQAIRPEIASALGPRARQRMLEGFTWPMLAQKYIDFFRSLRPVV